MSRIGKQPVAIAKGVEVQVANGRVRVKGPKGQLEEAVAPHTKVEVAGAEVRVARDSDEKRAKAMHGLMRALIANMVTGVTTGFSKSLDVIGVGYRAEVQGKKLTLTIGYSHPVVVEVPQGLEVVAESQTRLVIKGANKQQVGQFAAEVREVRMPEPYKGKGIRYVDEVVRRKVGKTGVSSGS
ncbi:MAG TPA: 50S ribosomal protein L6 [Myxococcota bacterium]|nr:50S ribosomal protein L6 [Myxococcota bacterium]